MFIFFAAIPDNPNDDQWLQQACQGSQEAIAQIYERYFDPIYQFVRWRVNDLAVAEDITSEVFVNFLNAIQREKCPTQSLRGWLFRVARNVLYDHRQGAIVTDELDEDLRDPATSGVEAQLLRAIEADRVRQAMRRLAADQQEVLVLRFDQMLNLQDTADVMGKSVSAVKSLQFRAINSLRRALAASSEADYDPI